MRKCVVFKVEKESFWKGTTYSKTEFKGPYIFHEWQVLNKLYTYALVEDSKTHEISRVPFYTIKFIEGAN